MRTVVEDKKWCLVHHITRYLLSFMIKK